MKTRRSVLMHTAAAAAALGLGPAFAQQGYPNRAIKLIVPFPAGGSSDVMARALGDKVGAALGQSVVVDNRSGGGTVIGAQAAATSRPDGYTLLQITPNAVVIGSLKPDLPYSLEKDFVPIVGVGAVPMLLAVPARSNLRTLADLVAVAKSNPGGLIYASGGVGSLGHLAPARLLSELKITGTHVPYRGVAPALQDLAGDRGHIMFVSSLEGMQSLKAGHIRVLGVTSEQRLPSLPDVPTMQELGMADFTPAVWYGFLAPAGTPPAIVARLSKVFAEAVQDPATRERLMSLGLTIRIRNSAEFAQQIRDETQRWARVVKDNKITLE
ncbi:tripartite tricarboxylate transporter substrate binding protein [Hydrogenophaga sp.]|uniref:Bug family tripartite tricarboxylate transporter substrate binding protein n=1 Tax=Hydrogenophaga sp. TaxID=1904254 RepID=UPI00271FCC13|nr:tripartite tricarboxylate transporter substrate binding protein [Hydrogenophaga sp.]MDO9437246.1 tripartite tricarboxylate transporter substrate binding protein [Hydrogenophaga sp.]